MTLTVIRRVSFAGRRSSSRLLRTYGNLRRNKKISEEEVLQVGMEQKASEFVERGAEIYADS